MFNGLKLSIVVTTEALAEILIEITVEVLIKVLTEVKAINTNRKNLYIIST